MLGTWKYPAALGCSMVVHLGFLDADSKALPLGILSGLVTTHLRKLPQIENNMKIEASISLRTRDEEVKVHGEPDCCNIG
jgi:hypothetical protein